MRGKILRDTNSGPGLIYVEGKQIQFSLEEHWKSDQPPKVGGVVDAEISDSGELLSVVAVDDTVLVKEQAQKVFSIVETQGKKIAEHAATNGKEYALVMIEKIGYPTLFSIVGLIISMVWLSTLNVNVSREINASVSFYQILKVVNNSGGLQSFGNLDYLNAGFYGFLFWISIIIIVLPHFIGGKYVSIVRFAPIIYMVVIYLGIYFTIKNSISEMNSAMSSFAGARGAELAKSMASEMLSGVMKSISLGFGFYMSIIISFFQAYLGFVNFRK